jgi:hypothetical protein
VSGRFHDLDAEMWLAGRIRDQIPAVFSGTTDRAIRVERMRREIVVWELGDTVIGKRAGKSETFATAFERICREPLQ